MKRLLLLLPLLLVLCPLAQAQEAKKGIFTDSFLNCHGWSTFTDSERTLWVEGYNEGLVLGSNGDASRGALLWPAHLNVGEIVNRITTRCTGKDVTETMVSFIVKQIADEMSQAKAAVSPEDAFAAQLQPVRNEFPSNWTFSLMDEHSWSTFLKAHHVNSTTAFTDLEHRVTYLREVYVSSTSPELLRHTLLHEAGHVSCNCFNEVRAERFAAVHDGTFHGLAELR